MSDVVHDDDGDGCEMRALGSHSYFSSLHLAINCCGPWRPNQLLWCSINYWGSKARKLEHVKGVIEQWNARQIIQICLQVWTEIKSMFFQSKESQAALVYLKSHSSSCEWCPIHVGFFYSSLVPSASQLIFLIHFFNLGILDLIFPINYIYRVENI